MIWELFIGRNSALDSGSNRLAKCIKIMRIRWRSFSTQSSIGFHPCDLHTHEGLTYFIIIMDQNRFVIITISPVMLFHIMTLFVELFRSEIGFSQ